MFCLKCGEVIPDGSTICPKCGADPAEKKGRFQRRISNERKTSGQKCPKQPNLESPV